MYTDQFYRYAERSRGQLLEKVVKREQPELERQKQGLVVAIQKCEIDLVDLEDQLSARLSNAPDDILSDVQLIESFEKTKKRLRISPSL